MHGTIIMYHIWTNWHNNLDRVAQENLNEDIVNKSKIRSSNWYTSHNTGNREFLSECHKIKTICRFFADHLFPSVSDVLVCLLIVNFVRVKYDKVNFNATIFILFFLFFYFLIVEVSI